LKILDKYIIVKFLGTFFLSIALIVSIAVVFDISEKIEDFISRKAPLNAIVFDYYFNFIPYFANLFSPLFIFISVIYFTSKMAYNTEIISILASGISFKRLLMPYLVCAGVLAGLSYYLNNFLIPHANKKRLEFEEAYIRNPFRNYDRNIHKQITPDTYVYFESYNNITNVGYKFSLEQFKENKLVYKLLSDFIQWDSTLEKWKINNYTIREINDLNEKITSGYQKDTSINIFPSDFTRRENVMEMMDYHQLNKFIIDEKFKGSEGIEYYEIEKQRRAAFPFATFVLTLIGVSIASKKVRGGIGAHIGVGIFISFSYILFMQVSTTFSTNAGLAPIISVWIPNILYLIFSLYLLKIAPK
jgi:lipopolysaccharide export system permease protein